MIQDNDVLLQVIAWLRKIICGDEQDEDDDEISSDEDDSTDEDDSSEDSQGSFSEGDWQYPHDKDIKCPSLKTEKLGKSKYDKVPVCGDEQDEDDYEISSDEDDSTDEDDSSEDSQGSFSEGDWQYPYHKDMKCPSLKTEKLGKSKYDKVFGPYRYDRVPERSLASREGARKKDNQSLSGKGTKRGPEGKGIPIQYVSLKDPDNSDGCGEIEKVEVMDSKSRISIPNQPSYEIVRQTCKERINAKRFKEKKSNDYCNSTDLKSWIFTPTHDRVFTGNLNLTHTMVKPDSEEEIFKSYVHVLVVRSGEFEQYCKRWGSSHVIMELPPEVPAWFAEYGDKCTAEAGKIGYARKFIQAFAQKYRLETIFMLDDNIPHFLEVVTDNGVIRRDEAGHVELQNIPLFKVLKHLEDLYDYEAPAPKEEYELCLGYDERSRHSYTGPPCIDDFENNEFQHIDYGVIGISRFGPYTRSRTKKPFKNTHVYKLCLINIQALERMKIEYKPWEVWEDLHLNNDCDQNGLYVVKFNRFVARCRNLHTWQPTVYEWSSETRLEVEGTVKLQKAADESDALLKYTRDWAAPGRCEDLNDSIQKPVELVSLVHKVKQLRRGKHHFASVRPDSLEEYLHITGLGLASFEKHVLVLPKTACLESGLVTLSDFRLRVIGLHFEPVSGDGEQDWNRVVTSHNVHQFDVSLILVYIEGKSKYNCEK